MPTLSWIGRDKVVGHHHDVPFKVLKKEYEFISTTAAPATPPRNSCANRIIHGDNLEALKALLPEFEGRIDCVYIDPVYNTGNEEWRYNDNVSDPRFLRWLNKVVGAANVDLTREDKWLCMMYPRLVLLRRLLSETGVILVSIDDNSDAYLKLLLSEIFGVSNFVGKIVWKNVTDNNPTQIATEHEYVIVYAKDKKRIPPEWKSANLAVKERLIETERHFLAEYADDDERQAAYSRWFRDNKAFLWPFEDYKFIDRGGIYAGIRGVHNPGKEGYRYDVMHRTTGRPCIQPMMGYRFPEETMKRLLAEDRILFGEDENKIIELKVYARDYRAKLSSLIELDGRMGTNELKAIFPENKRPFDFPKPSALLEELFSFAAPNNALFLDSFGGSGTTAHAVLKLNAQDRGTRRFILIELLEYADTLTAERVKRVINGYRQGSKSVAGLGGSFEYYTIGEPLFDDHGNINAAADVAATRQYIAYTEGLPTFAVVAVDNPISPAFIGQHDGRALLFHYDPCAVTTLNYDFLAGLRFSADTAPERLVIYADYCTLADTFLAGARIVFKKIPRDVTRL